MSQNFVCYVSSFASYLNIEKFNFVLVYTIDVCYLHTRLVYTDLQNYAHLHLYGALNCFCAMKISL